MSADLTDFDFQQKAYRDALARAEAAEAKLANETKYRQKLESDCDNACAQRVELKARAEAAEAKVSKLEAGLNHRQEIIVDIARYVGGLGFPIEEIPTLVRELKKKLNEVEGCYESALDTHQDGEWVARAHDAERNMREMDALLHSPGVQRVVKEYGCPWCTGGIDETVDHRSTCKVFGTEAMRDRARMALYKLYAPKEK